ncbi:hypothetical protein DENSPDRAFT_931311 [Dentipellis sp. KUC8613]|nr:hypothetical protein DENSPDRAFT_931311 [Dentipellis sp. KUC8613]
MASSSLSPMDEIYSLYSQPAMTRANTASTSEPLPTPLDGLLSRRGSKQGVSGPRKMNARRDNDMVRVYSQTSDPARSHYGDRPLDAVPEMQEYSAEPYEDYFSLPYPGTAQPVLEPPPLLRRKSTKDLIDRFESMYSGSSSSGPRSNPSAASGRVSRDLSPVPTEKTSKKRSPLRQSIRNFISLISKKGKSSSKDNSDGLSLVQSIDKLLPKIPALDPFLDVPAASFRQQDGSQSTVCTSPTYALFSGPVLHLSRRSNIMSPVLPVWTTCDAVLHAHHILLTTHTSRGTPTTEIVSLTGCTDVRSVPSRELADEEYGLLPTQTSVENPKVFEVCFAGRDPERFAASSVKGRAAWVSAIWDVILHAQEQSISERNKSQVDLLLKVDATLSAEGYTGTASPAPSDNRTSSLLDAYNEPSPQSASQPPERGLPRFPEAADRCATPDRHPETVPDLAQRLALSVDTSPGRLARTPSSTPSPSILHLGQMSVVKQRLAAMQSKTSSSGSASASSSSRASQSQSSALTPSTRLTTPASSQYGGTRLTTPVGSQYSGSSTSRRQRSSEVSERPRSTHLAAPESDTASRLTSPVSAVSDGSAYSPASTRPKSAFRLREEMRMRDKALSMSGRTDSVVEREMGMEMETPTAPTMERGPSLASSTLDRPPSQLSPLDRPHSQLSASTNDEDMAALLDVMDVHAELQQNHVAAVGEQVAAVHASVQGLAADVRTAHRDARQVVDMRGMLETLANTIARNEIVRSAPAPGLGEESERHVLEVLEDIRMNLKVDLPTVVRMLREIKATTSVPTQTLANEKPSISGLPTESSVPPAEMLAVNDKLDALMAICKQLNIARPGPTPAPAVRRPPTPAPVFPPAASPRPDGAQKSELEPESSGGIQETDSAEEAVMKDESAPAATELSRSAIVSGSSDKPPTPEELQEILTLLRTDQNQRTVQMEQQADSVRYLNELNTWLEAFVSSGTAQIQDVAAGVKQLCRELGTGDDDDTTEMADVGAGGDGGEGGPPKTIMGDLRRFLVDSEARGRDTAKLQTTVDGLIAAMNEDMRKNAEMRNAYTTESVIGFIDRQRQDQERMLRAIAAELSNDIKGERLRFVEAMKEATAINVQIHVEEFKKELTREVLLMTQDVSRLQRERQTLEQQIADLFAFYSKQKQAGAAENQMTRSHAMPRPESVRPSHSSHSQPPPPERPKSHRALPNPPPGQN